MNEVDATLDQALIVDVSRMLLERLAPEEVPLLRPHAEAFFRHPTRRPIRREKGDDLLGFGAGDAVPLLVPALLAVVKTVLDILNPAIKEAIRAQATTVVNAAIRQLLLPLSTSASPGRALDAPVRLSATQLAAMRNAAQETAQALDVPEARARALADAIVGAMVTKD